VKADLHARYRVERLCYALDRDADLRAQLAHDAQGLLQRFDLDPELGALLVNGDVGAMHACGVHPYLLNRLQMHRLFSLTPETFSERIRSGAGVAAVVPSQPVQPHNELLRRARTVARRVIRLSARQPVHLGASLSCIHILTVLYFAFLRVRSDDPMWPDRDRFVLSKGHAAAALYAVLIERGFLPPEVIGELPGHPADGIPGVEVATGSLGHGLPVACGLAVGARLTGRTHRVVALLGDGELDEGSNWEAALFAAHRHLANLVVIVDRNGVQQEGPTAEVLDLEPLSAKWSAFGWRVSTVDGHDPAAVLAALEATDRSAGPSVVLARTVKGKGVSFMENDPAWHVGQLRGASLRRALSECSDDRQGRSALPVAQ
jgi:transketolase